MIRYTMDISPLPGQPTQILIWTKSGFIPAGHSPNKNESGMTLPEYRAEMVALAVKPYPYFKMSTVEIEAEETSYTYLTLTK